MGADPGGPKDPQTGREKQKAVRLGRRYFNPKGRGRGKGQGYRPREADDPPPRGPCLRCGKGHATRDCPQKLSGESRKVLQAEAHSEFVCFAEHMESSLYGDTEGEMSWHQEEGRMTTHKAMLKGYGVLDGGATRTMGSMVALEQAREASFEHQSQDNVAEVNLEDRPTFGFADSESATCQSTVLLRLPIADRNLKLRVHALDKGSVPVLLSIDTLKRLQAIVDYSRDEVIFGAIDPCKRVKLQTTVTGHQVLISWWERSNCRRQ